MQDADEKLKQIDGLSRRIDGIDKDAERFGREAARIVELTAAELGGLPADQAATDLHDRLIVAERTRTKVIELEKRRREDEGKRDKARQQIEGLRAELDQMCREAACASADALPAAERRSAKRRDIEENLDLLEEQLIQLAGSVPLLDFIASTEQADPDQLEARLHHLTREIETLDGELGAIRETIGTERNELNSYGRQCNGCGRPGISRAFTWQNSR